MQRLIFDLPINGVSFGQVSTDLLREAFSRDLDCAIFPLGEKMDLNTQNLNPKENENDQKFLQWLSTSAEKVAEGYDSNTPCFKLWHLNKASFASYSNRQFLMTFHELNQPTKLELAVCNRAEKVIFTSKYSCEVFKAAGAKNVEHIPLGFDKYNFKTLNKKYFGDDRIVFSLCGKFEHRKNHAKILAAWAKKYGDNKKYYLNCQLWNPFLDEKQNSACISRALDNKKYFNINFLGFLQKNSLYNDFLNSANIVIGMSGGEGWGLPEFHSVALGKHGVIMNAHSYKDWANDQNSVLVEPSGMKPVYDGVFFNEGNATNQGEIFDFDEDQFIAGCEEAIKRYKENPVNENGLKLQEEFSTSKTLDRILEVTQ